MVAGRFDVDAVRPPGTPGVRDHIVSGRVAGATVKEPALPRGVPCARTAEAPETKERGNGGTGRG